MVPRRLHFLTVMAAGDYFSKFSEMDGVAMRLGVADFYVLPKKGILRVSIIVVGSTN